MQVFAIVIRGYILPTRRESQHPNMHVFSSVFLVAGDKNNPHAGPFQPALTYSY